MGYNSGYNALISDCYYLGTVTSTSSGTDGLAGGITGVNERGATVRNCYSCAQVEVPSKIATQKR